MNAEVVVRAGVCGFVSTVVASSDDSQNVSFEIVSDCENIRRLAENLREVDAYAEIGAGFDGAIHLAVRETLKGCCSGCVVPAGIFKAMQVAAALALPACASLEVRKR